MVLAAALTSTSSRGAATRPHADIYPMAGVTTANPGTRIAFRGVTAAQLDGLRVSGSETGRHGGRLRPHPDGGGVTWVPKRPFRQGERVTVRAPVRLTGSRHGTVRFSIYRAPSRHRVGGKLGPDPGGTPREAQRFRTRPDLAPANLVITKRTDQASGDDIFVAPKAGPGQNGPQIRDARGRLIWTRPVGGRLSPYDFRAQRYRGQPVLTWWQGGVYTGKGRGHGVILDRSYRVIGRVYAGNGYSMDQHEFEITPRNTAYITIFQPVRYNLRPAHGPRHGLAWDSVVQEIDIRTGIVLFEWHSLSRVSVGLGTFPIRPGVYDPFHVNSVSVERNGNLLLSARNADTMFLVDRHDGRVIWRLGGKRSSFRMHHGTHTRGQHQATRQADGTIRVFDNGGSTRFPKRRDHQSRGVVLRLFKKPRRAYLVHQYLHPHRRLYSRSQGSIQRLANGNVFLSWGGGNPQLTEFTYEGRQVFEAYMNPRGDDTYRAYRLPWSGARPGGRPAVVARIGKDRRTRVYVSWNGATDVTRWTVSGGSHRAALLPLGSSPWTNFETRITLAKPPPRYVVVRGLDAHGAVLGTSRTVKTKGP